MGKAISLRVTFSDDAGYSESLTSAETADVVASGATRELLWIATLTVERQTGAQAGQTIAGMKSRPTTNRKPQSIHVFARRHDLRIR